VTYSQNGRKLAPENLCPEALEARCTVCNKNEATDDNDLAMCDRCDKAYHQKCHDPPVERFGNFEDDWYCASCTAELLKMRGLTIAEGDFVWARFGDAPVWPGRVLRVDFSSLTDPKPYWVRFYDPKNKSEGAWMSDTHVEPWSKGPSFASVRDAQRKLAVRLAEADGAAPISGCGPQAPRTPLPRLGASTPRLVPSAPPPQKRPRTEATPRRRLRRASDDAAAGDGSSAAPAVMLSQQAAEVQQLIDAAKARQARLEREIDEVIGSQPAV